MTQRAKSVVWLSYVLPLCLAIAVYVVAGLYWDVPPYSISLINAVTHIELTDRQAVVDSDLMYFAAKGRETSVYLPFERSADMGEATDVVGTLPPPSTYEVRPDGVLLTLRLEADHGVMARFHFVQALTGHHFLYDFSLERGWLRATAPVSYFVVAAAPVRVNRDGVAAAKELAIEHDSSGKSLEVSW